MKVILSRPSLHHCAKNLWVINLPSGNPWNTWEKPINLDVVADVKSLLQTGLHSVLSCVSYITAHLFETVGVYALYLLLTWKTTRISIGGSACKISNNRGCGKRIRGKLTHWRINSRSGQATEASFKIAWCCLLGRTVASKFACFSKGTLFLNKLTRRSTTHLSIARIENWVTKRSAS